MNNASQPRLSLVIPTTGTDGSVIRLLNSVVNEAPKSLLTSTEVIVYLNKHPDVEVDVGRIEQYTQTLSAIFHSTVFRLSDVLHLTAEASARAAVSYASGEFLWIAGDKRIFLPEGLRQLTRFLDTPPTPCAYFNSVRQERNGYTNAYASTHSSASVTTISYKRLVQKLGINFMPTNMGTWIFRREFLDLDLWTQVMNTCGPHFSHVTTLLATMGDAEVVSYAVYLTILELKPYHGGDSGEWTRYAKLAKSYTYYPWTFGMVRQFQFLVDRGAYSYSDIRRSMCSEAMHLGTQVHEIYTHFVSQIQLGWKNASERMTQSEFDEIWSFLVKACPERMVINGLIDKLYRRSLVEEPRYANKVARSVFQALAMDYDAVRFASLIVGQVGDRFIRLHPDGYLISAVSDNVGFQLAYRLIDAPAIHENWKIIGDDELYDLRLTEPVQDVGALFPAPVSRDFIRNPNRERKYKRIRRAIVRSVSRALRAPAALFKRISRF